MTGGLGRHIRHHARQAPADLAETRGPFPVFLSSTHARRGLGASANAQLTSVAPARHGALGTRSDDDKVALEADPVQRPRGTARPS